MMTKIFFSKHHKIAFSKLISEDFGLIQPVTESCVPRLSPRQLKSYLYKKIKEPQSLATLIKFLVAEPGLKPGTFGPCLGEKEKSLECDVVAFTLSFVLVHISYFLFSLFSIFSVLYLGQTVGGLYGGNIFSFFTIKF